MGKCNLSIAFEYDAFEFDAMMRKVYDIEVGDNMITSLQDTLLFHCFDQSSFQVKQSQKDLILVVLMH